MNHTELLSSIHGSGQFEPEATALNQLPGGPLICIRFDLVVDAGLDFVVDCEAVVQILNRSASIDIRTSV